MNIHQLVELYELVWRENNAQIYTCTIYLQLVILKILPLMPCLMGYKPSFRDVLMILTMIKDNEYDFGKLCDIVQMSRKNLNTLVNHMYKWELIDRGSIDEKLSISPKGENVLSYSYRQHTDVKFSRSLSKGPKMSRLD